MQYNSFLFNMNSKKFRIKASGSKLPGRIAKRDQLRESTKLLSQNKPKIFQRYGKLTEVKTTGSLVSTVIEEHLLKFGHLKTFDSYITEVAQKAQHTLEAPKVYKISELSEHLMKNFDDGNESKLFRIWEQLVKRVQVAKEDYPRNRRMEFKLRVLMAIYYLHPHAKTRILDEDQVVDLTSERLARFNEFLGNEGSEFLDDDEFSPLFSIPYILTTKEDNESLEYLFEKEFIEIVKSELATEVESMIEGIDEDAGLKTLLEEMADYYIKHSQEQQDQESNAQNDLDEIQEEAKMVIEEIGEAERSNAQKKKKLNILANKYERLNNEFSSYKARREERYILEAQPLQSFLVISKAQNHILKEEEKKKLAKKLKEEEKKKRRAPQYLKSSAQEEKEEEIEPIKKIFIPYANQDYYDQLEDIWKRCQVKVLDHTSKLLKSIEQGENPEDIAAMLVQANEIQSILQDVQHEIQKDPNAVFEIADKLGVNTRDNLTRIYEIKEAEITSKIIEGLAYDGEAILCFLLKKLKANPYYEFEGIQKVIIYALEKFGEMRDEFLDPKEIKADKFGDRVFLYELLMTFIQMVCNRYDVKDTLRESDLIVETFNQFHDFIDANDNLMSDVGILDMMNLFNYKVLYLVLETYVDTEFINDEQLLKNLINLALNQDTYKIQEKYKEEVLTLIYAVIYLNSGEFKKLLPLHRNNLAVQLFKDLADPWGGEEFKAGVIALLLKLSSFLKLQKIRGAESSISQALQVFPATSALHVPLTYLHSLVSASSQLISSSSGAPMFGPYIPSASLFTIPSLQAEERLWYYEQKGVNLNILKIEELRKKNDALRKNIAQATKAK